MSNVDNIKEMILELENEDIVKRHKAITKLAKTKNNGLVELLIKLLADNTSNLFKESVCDILGEKKSKEAVEVLIGCLTDIDDGIKFKATIALGKIGDKRATKPLTKKLNKNVDSLLKSEAIIALGRIGDESATKPLISILKFDQDLFVKHHAVRALGEIGSKEAIKPLLEFANKKRKSRLNYLAHEAILKINNN
jgi:HEAT repeat protein